MKINQLFTMMAIALVTVFGVCSCGSDDDEPEVAVATQVAGSYTGQEIILVMADESSNETKTYEFVKVTDTSVDMTIPQSGMGPMSIPPLPVKNIPLAKGENNIIGKLASYTGTVTTDSGAERAYTISNVVIMFNGNTVVASFSLKYGNMPFAMETSFTGTKK